MTKGDYPCCCPVCGASPCLCAEVGSEPNLLPDFDLDRFHRELAATGAARVLVRFEEEEEDDPACFLLSGTILREH